MRQQPAKGRMTKTIKKVNVANVKERTVQGAERTKEGMMPFVHLNIDRKSVV